MTTLTNLSARFVGPTNGSTAFQVWRTSPRRAQSSFSNALRGSTQARANTEVLAYADRLAATQPALADELRAAAAAALDR